MHRAILQGILTSYFSHLIGLFNRTIAFIESGVRPIWVFDGKPPELKREELKRRAEAKKEAEELAVEAKETGDAEQIQ
jgi:flap endonuclease-1